MTQAQSNLSQSECKNDSSFKTAYSSGWSAGFNGGTHNNFYQGENRRRCYEWGYTDGSITKRQLNLQKFRSDSLNYQSCLSLRLLNPSHVCQPPILNY
ncbi:hypothetical protein PN471_17315 [Aphanizomenon sp. CS-733/32]|uniref:hypothetical protein n=1 Tax=Aphanizomenon sp. CS-733/32 TaxID=3021715 RepID=UPI00232D2083|nr:hypothetical protein [Aphanizomenon sp. CS-733/32]MDB9310358.1 hypothetical protein [Aphanizomenon sp. CS-733/32]